MHLDRLRGLHRAMGGCGLDRCTFPFARNRARFHVFFFTDRTPFGLMFGLVGGQFSFSVDVLRGYRIDTRLDRETYDGLFDALGLTYDPNRPFRPADFFGDLNRAIPQRVTPHHEPSPHDVARYCRDVEEADKIYFVAWRPNEGKQAGNVTEHNLHKTRVLLGEDAHTNCRIYNISSVWSDNPRKRSEQWKRELRLLEGHR